MIKKLLMEKQKLTYNYPSGLEKSISTTCKTINHQRIKTKMKPIRNTKRETKLNTIIYILLIVNLRLKFPKNTSIIEPIDEAI